MRLLDIVNWTFIILVSIISAGNENISIEEVQFIGYFAGGKRESHETGEGCSLCQFDNRWRDGCIHHGAGHRLRANVSDGRDRRRLYRLGDDTQVR